MPGARAKCPRELIKCRVVVRLRTGNFSHPTFSNTLAYEVPGDTNRVVHGRLKNGKLLARVRRQGRLKCGISLVIRAPAGYSGGLHTSFYGVTLTSRR